MWTPGWPCQVGRALAPLQHGSSDPCQRVEASGRIWRAMRTPIGPATICVALLSSAATIEARAWGAGAAWALDQLPAMLGAADDPSGFEPRRHRLVAELWRRAPHERIGRTGLIVESLVAAILEQKVTGQEAWAGYRRLVRRYGEPAAGPLPDLWLPPSPAVLALIPSWEWLQLPVDPARSGALVRAARVAASLDRLVTRPSDEVDRGLRSLPGVGGWTSAEVRVRALGDPDAVSFGDYHLATNVTWALAGVRGDDALMAELLEPWRGHRQRVVRLLEHAGAGPERRGARMAPRTHLPASATARRPAGLPRPGTITTRPTAMGMP